MELTKQEVIRLFKQYCDNNKHRKYILDIFDSSRKNKIKNRELIIKHQINRDVWEIQDEDIGIIRIENSGYIFFFPTVVYANKHNLILNDGEFKTRITIEEFAELKKCYFGDYTPDYEYLKIVGADIF